MYHDIHCPFCGHINNPMEVKYSLTEFIAEIDELGKTDNYNDGILGVIDTDNINIILNNELFWDMSAEDINDCYVGEMFTIEGASLIRRFGLEAVAMLDLIDADTVSDIKRSNDVDRALSEEEDVQNLVTEILTHLTDQKILRSDTTREQRRDAVLDMIEYAKRGETLFKIKLHIESENDDNGFVIGKELRSNDNHIIGKSKRCANCGNMLSKLAGKYEEKVISFLGTPAAGKSAYLAAVMHKLMTTGRNEYNIEVVFDHKSADYLEFRANCLEPYSKGFAVIKTNEDVFPQISLALRNLLTNKTYLYTFADMPGETFMKDEGFDVAEVLNNRRILEHSAVVWYCVSANQLFTSKVSLPLDLNADGGTKNEETKDLTIMGLNTIAFTNALFGDNKKRPAVAMIVTKTDLISEFVANTHFDGNETNDKIIHKEYYKTVCPMLTSESVKGYDYCNGEPTSLDYIKDGKINFNKLINLSTATGNFVKKYGENMAVTFMGNVGTAFGKNGNYPCFAQASYGRDNVEKYVSPLESAVKFLMSIKHSLTERESAYLQGVFGKDNLLAFERGEAPLNRITNQDYINNILTMHAKYNPATPFGVMNTLVWTLCYTGFMECVEPHGDTWKTVPVQGDEFVKLQNNLEHLIPGNICADEPVKREEESKKGGFFGGLFGKR